MRDRGIALCRRAAPRVFGFSGFRVFSSGCADRGIARCRPRLRVFGFSAQGARTAVSGGAETIPSFVLIQIVKKDIQTISSFFLSEIEKRDMGARSSPGWV